MTFERLPDRIRQTLRQDYGARVSARPFIPFMGGKSRHAALIAGSLSDVRDYWEPFLGGGAVFFRLVQDSRARVAHLSDKDSDLIALWCAVRDDPRGLYAAFRAMYAEAESGEAQQVFVSRRAAWNSGTDRTPANQLFLRYNAFNGVWRLSARGHLNSPFRHKLRGPTIARLLACSQALQDVDLRVADFRSLRPPRGAAVYADPPYYDAATAYTQGGFTEDDQVMLLDACAAWTAAGATVVYTNHDREWVRIKLRELWPAASIRTYGSRRSVNSDGTRRGEVGELLVVGRPK